MNEGLIYGDIEEQLIIVNIYSEVLLVRESLEEVVSPQTEGPMHQVLCKALGILPFASFLE